MKTSTEEFTMLPLPPPLRGNEPGSFAEDTLGRRLPGIARQAAAEALPPEASKRLLALAEDMPSGCLRPLEDPGAPDLADWQAGLERYLGQTWLEAPWFPAETYFFRRILEATGYFQSGPGQEIDPYRTIKEQGLSGVAGQLAQALARLQLQTETWASQSQPERAGTLARLLRQVLWGNQADLSIWPVGGAKPSPAAQGQPPPRLLVDGAPAAAAYILSRPGGLGRVDFILDNIGLELGYDLLLANFLLDLGLVHQVRLHAKPFPTYVSDATIPDIQAFIRDLAGASEEMVRQLGTRLSADLLEERLQLQTDLFWTSPFLGWQMPGRLRQELAEADLLISKGDANYRRWLGDLHWLPTAPLQQILAYRPAPLLLLRVMKSDIVAGLQPGQAEQLDQSDPTWQTNGRTGLIQFIETT